MRVRLNREFLVRHLFVVLLMFALGAWFGYDGIVRYPATPAHDLYVSIEKSEPPPGVNLEAFKAQKEKTQIGLMLLSVLAGAAVGAHLYAVSRFRLFFTETGFAYRGRRYRYDDVTGLDDSQWKRKGISVVSCGDVKVKVDSWHHSGIKQFHECVADAVSRRGGA